MSQNWYVVHTQPNREPYADLHLRRQGFTTYLPRYLRSRRHARKTETVARPLFPRYLFVAIDIERDRWRSIGATVGVSHLLQAGEAPVSVPDRIVAEIRSRQGDDGYVALGLPSGVGAGSRVRLVDGIFADAKGVLERIADDRRVAILLELLGREVRVLVPAASVGIV
ncbi:MAG: transcription termination/antitermination protein NusG [Pseudorhodoplanes sp.]